jgi:hypothetical protein
MSGLALLVVIALWNLPWLEFIVYPLRLFVTFIHETGHILAVVLTGGQPRGFAVFPDGSGVAYTIGGWRALIIPAGYVGTAVFGAVLFYLANTIARPRRLTTLLGYGLIVFSVVFILPDPLNGILALMIGSLFGILLINAARHLSDALNLLILNVIALTTGFNAVLDALYLVRVPNARGIVLNDAAAFSAEFAPLIPAGVWALLWAALSAVLLGLSIYLSIIRPRR